MDISDWRKKIDEIDRKLVELVNQRAHAAREIGRLKRGMQAPIYEPEREKDIFENICRLNQGPLENRELIQIYERIIDVMRNLQKFEREKAAAQDGPAGNTEIEAELND
ncbi:MAG TPA: chorismate mutase [Terriglobales bacterium]|jgi:chorismate mutase|nr:chorismate mutase [Terriglobales bacterium]